MTDLLTILQGDCREVLKTLPDESVQCCVTSPPYWWLRDYGTAKWDGGDDGCDHRHKLGGEGDSSAKQNTSAGTQSIAYRDICGKCGARRIDSQIGLEETPQAYVETMRQVFAEVRRVLRKDGTLWLNLGDSYNGSRGGEQGKGGQMADRSVAAARCRVRGWTLNAGLKPKDLCGIPWRVAFALQADGWWLRSDIIWSKPNPMPESVTDRPTKSHEYLFLMSKAPKYYYDAAAIAEPSSMAMLNQMKEGYNGEGLKDYEANGVQNPSSVKSRIIANARRKHRVPAGWDTSSGAHGTIHREGRAPSIEYSDVNSITRNKRSVWTVNTAPYAEAHFATFPPDLIKPCILAGCPVGGVVLDPFAGSFTTCAVALELGRKAIGIELNPEYIKLGKERCNITPGLPLTV